MLKTIACAAFSLLGVAVIAQQNPAPQPKRMLTWVAAQAPQVKRLSDALSGKWKTTEKFEADEFHKSGATGSGVFSIREGPGGNSLILDYKSQSSMGSYSSTRIIYWDGRADDYKAFYCDSLQPGGCGGAGTGKWEGKDLVFESTTKGHRGSIQVNERFSDISSVGFTFSLDVVDRGKSERSLTIQARKMGAKP